MTAIHFAHANGFPGATYQALFERLDLPVTYVDKFAHDEAFDGDLRTLAVTLIDEIEQKHSEPVIGIGHSLGGMVTLIASSQRPDLFRHLILIEPILLAPYKRAFLKLMQITGLMQLWPLVKNTRNRRHQFKDRDEAEKHFRKKTLYKAFDDESLAHYLEHGLETTDEGVALSFSPEIEAHIFGSVYSGPAPVTQTGVTLLYANKSNFIMPADINYWRRRFPEFELIEVDGGHMFPFEQLEKSAELLNTIVARVMKEQA